MQAPSISPPFLSIFVNHYAETKGQICFFLWVSGEFAAVATQFPTYLLPHNNFMLLPKESIS